MIKIEIGMFADIAFHFIFLESTPVQNFPCSIFVTLHFGLAILLFNLQNILTFIFDQSFIMRKGID